MNFANGTVVELAQAIEVKCWHVRWGNEHQECDRVPAGHYVLDAPASIREGHVRLVLANSSKHAYVAPREAVERAALV